MLVVGTAHADVNWDAVAACESGGNWAINTGNSFFGGLQFSLPTWLSNGGSGMPQNASRAEQIRVAENVLRTQGIGAWPVCGRKAGTVPTVSKTVIPAKPRPVPAGNTTPVTVHPGDTLSVIAAVHGTTWQQLQTLNGIADADRIYAGQRLRLS